MKYEILDSRDIVGVKSETNGLIFNNIENNKALSENSTVFNTGCTAGTMGYEVTSIIIPSADGLEYLDIRIPISYYTLEAVGLDTLLVSLVAGNNYDCIGTVYEVSGTDTETSLWIELYDKDYVKWDTSKFPPANKAYIYFPKHPEVGNIIVNEAPAFAAGVNSVASQEASAVFGEDCCAAGKRSFVAGRDNMAGYISAAFGRKNNIRGYYSIGAGYKNDVASSAEKCAVFGTNNKVCSNNTVIEGNGNTDGYGQTIGNNHIEGTNNTIANGCYGTMHIEGESNTVEINGQASHIEGVHNTLKSGLCNHISGVENTVTGSYNTISGRVITVTGDSNDVGGMGNSISGEHNFVRGYDNTVSGNYKTVFGRRANVTDDTLFAVGNGADVNERANAFEILSDGSARIQTESTEDDAVVRYNQLKAALDRITELETQLSNMVNVAEVGQ